MTLARMEVCSLQYIDKLKDEYALAKKEGDTRAMEAFNDAIKECEHQLGVVVRYATPQKSKKPEQKKYGFRAMLEDAWSKPAPVQRTFPPDYEKEARARLFPLKCTEICKYRTCPYHNDHHYGEPCAMRFENFENEAWWKEYQKKIAPPNLNEQLLR